MSANLPANDDLDTLFARAARGDAPALVALRAAAGAGDGDAMFLLGRLHELSREARQVATDLAVARAWYERAATAGVAAAQFALANMYENGEGAPWDEAMARYWYERAALQGDAEAQMSFARMLQTGRGGKPAIAAAAAWYRRAADQGHELAATNLAIMHYQKEVADASDAVAFEFFGIAAERLDGLAHLLLAEMWLEGRGTPRQGARALFHYCVAALLLPDGQYRGRAAQQRERILASYPALRRDFEARAARYVEERSAAGSARSPR